MSILCLYCFQEFKKSKIPQNEEKVEELLWDCVLCKGNFNTIGNLSLVCDCLKSNDSSNDQITHICLECTKSKKINKYKTPIENEHLWCLHPKCIESVIEFVNKYQLECHYKNEHR